MRNTQSYPLLNFHSDLRRSQNNWIRLEGNLELSYMYNLGKRIL